jgi:protein-L-isoaspartate(D-aspartate) O-methyltransferase
VKARHAPSKLRQARLGVARLSPQEDAGDLCRERPAGRRRRGAAERWGLRLCLAALAAVALTAGAAGSAGEEARWTARRWAMVDEQIARRGIEERTVLEAMRRVPRHLFVPPAYEAQAYSDRPLPIGKGQTISQPYTVALMTQLLDLHRGDKVLEIGTGSGYHAAVLSQVAGEVYTIEIVESLGVAARERLRDLGYRNVHVRIGDGYRGWPEAAPFDAIVLTAAPSEIPQPLLDQLKVGGRMVLPEGRGVVQDLLLVTKTAESVERQRVAAVRFVPMTGEADHKGN